MIMPADPVPNPDAARRRRSALRRLVPFGLLVALLIAAYAVGWHRDLSLEMLVRHSAVINEIIAGHRAAAVLLFVAVHTVGTALAMPAGAVLAVIGGFLFGTLIGGVAAMIGSSAGATIVFLIARSAFGGRLVHRVGPLAAKFAAGFRADAFCYLLFLRLIPVPSWFTNLTAALLDVRLLTFATATALGRTPGSFTFALFGAGLDSVIAAEEAAYRACLAGGGIDCRIDVAPSDVLTPTALAALAGLALLALMPVLARRLLLRRAAVRPERS